MNQKLYYTVESILAELAWLICHNKNLPSELIQFYNVLQNMHNNSEFDYYIQHYEHLTSEVLVEELTDEFHNNLDIFFEDLIKEASETNTN